MKLKHVLHEALFLFLIIFSVVDLLELLPGEVNVTKKLLSWLLVGYLLYYFSLTRILFNNRNRKMDLLLLLSFYFFAFKNLSHFIVNEELLYLNFMKTFLYKNQILNEIMFYLGSLSILLWSLFAGFNLNYKEDSLLGILRRPKAGKSAYDKIADSIIIYAILLFFSYFIFAVIMEWFALAIDSYVIIGALVYYIVVFYIIHRRKTYKPFLQIVAETGDELIKLFLGLFQNKRTVYFGISGVIVMHAVIDIANFLLPYIFNLHKAFYLSTLAHETHQTILNLLQNNLDLAPALLSQISIVYVYIQNIVSVFLLLLIPFLIWIKIFNKQRFHLPKWVLALFFSAIVCFLFSPVFKVSALKNLPITGVDITTHSLQNYEIIPIISIVSVLWFFIIYVLSSIPKIKNRIDDVVIFSSIFFLGQYVYYFYHSTLLYYIRDIYFLFQNSKILLMFYIILYLIMITLFYISGFILFVFEVLTSEHVSFLRLNLKLQKEIIFAWSVILYLLFVFLVSKADILILIILMLSSFILSFVLFRYERDTARYMLTINLVLGSFLLMTLVSRFADLNTALLELITRLFLITISVVMIFALNIKLGIGISLRRLITAIVVGGASGFWFILLREPRAHLLWQSLGYIIIFSFLISLTEELIFRVLVQKTACAIFPLKYSLLIQAFFFALLHLINYDILLISFGIASTSALFLSLIVFGILMGLLNIEKEKTNPLYSIAAHTIAVLFLYLPLSTFSIIF
ncbi:hypothetical protein JW930_05405 [Candidatus Woesearchaeota archaeon]|nr:hypothetical protein [Candidatus Woesearchaeota archaeon]